MASQQNNVTSYTPSEPKPCANNCGFFGTSDNRNLCSKCYKQCHQEQSSAINSVLCLSAAPPPLPDAVKPFFSAVPSPCAAEPSKPTNRCGGCNRRVGLTGFLCKCGTTFCAVHRYPDKHNCTYDFKTAGREEICKNNPLVKGDKIQRF